MINVLTIRLQYRSILEIMESLDHDFQNKISGFRLLELALEDEWHTHHTHTLQTHTLTHNHTHLPNPTHTSRHTLTYIHPFLTEGLWNSCVPDLNAPKEMNKTVNTTLWLIESFQETVFTVSDLRLSSTPHRANWDGAGQRQLSFTLLPAAESLDSAACFLQDLGSFAEHHGNLVRHWAKPGSYILKIPEVVFDNRSTSAAKISKSLLHVKSPHSKYSNSSFSYQ